MRRLVCAALVSASLIPALPRPAEAWYGGGGFLFGTAVGLATGAVIGGVLARPYYYPYYPYYYPAPVYAVPTYPPAVAYPPPVAYYPPPAYAVAPAYTAPAARPSGYAAAAPAPAARTPSCPAGQFFNTYTGNCDRR